MNIKKIINFQVKENKDKTLQQKSIKALGYFLVLMVLCTLLSRFADSLTIPIVKTDRSKQMTISHDVTAEGSILQRREVSISTLENIKVKYVNVGEGSNVKTGDVLVELDLDDINKQMAEINKQIADKKKSISRAQEDYNNAAANIDKSIQTALNEYKAAEKALNEYRKKSKEEKEQSPVSEDMLVEDYNSKKSIYDEAVNGKDASLLSYKRNLEDAAEENKTDDLDKSLADLQKIASVEGKVVAENEGVVTSVIVTPGTVTTSGAILTMADKSGGYKFTAQISKDLKKYAAQGQAVTLQITDNNQVVDNITIDSVTKDTENAEMYNITVNLPEGIGEVGYLGKLNISSAAKKYATCVPLAALHSEGNNQYYVLVINKVDTVLGEEMKAQKISVQVKDKNDTFAGLDDGVISSSQDLIISSNKNINDGDRVRKGE